MKRKFLSLIGLSLVLIIAMTSCKKDEVTKDVPIKNQTVVFDVTPAVSKDLGRGEEVLYDGVVNINIAQAIESFGVSFDNIKSFAITMGTLEEEVPSGFDMQGFIGAKLYFDSRENLVAQADLVEGTKLRFTIVNGELLDKLENDQLHVILVGVRPSVQLRLVLTMDFVANFAIAN